MQFNFFKIFKLFKVPTLKFGNLFNASLSEQYKKTVQRAPAIFICSAILSFSLAFTGYFALGLPFLNPIVAASSFLGGLCCGLLAWEFKRILPINFFKRTSYPKTLKTGAIKIGRKTVAFLDYIKDLPILYLFTKNAKESGQAISKAFKHEIIDAFDQYYDYLPTVAQFLHIGTKHFEWDMIQALREQRKKHKVHIPKHYLEQFQGLVDELNKIIKQDNKKWLVQRAPLTVDNIIDLLLFPDFFKFGACTSGTEWDQKNGISSLFRNLDWPTFGAMDIYSMILASPIIQSHGAKKHSSSKPQALLNISFQPGIAGLTITNDRGLCIAINEATKMSTIEPNEGGIPELLLITEIARNCSTIEQVRKFLLTNQPLTPHILTIKEKSGEAVKLQMLPLNSDKLFEEVAPDADNHAVAANHFNVPETGETVHKSMGWPDSEHRYDKAHSALKEDSGSPGAVEKSGCAFTTHSIIFKQKLATLDVKVKRDKYFGAESKVPTVKFDAYEVLDKVKSGKVRV